jgi:hypothetical protein
LAYFVVLVHLDRKKKEKNKMEPYPLQPEEHGQLEVGQTKLAVIETQLMAINPCQPQ